MILVHAKARPISIAHLTVIYFIILALNTKTQFVDSLNYKKTTKKNGGSSILTEALESCVHIYGKTIVLHFGLERHLHILDD